MLTAEELTSIRATAESTLSSTCNIVTLNRTRDARGQVTEVSVTGPDFACAVDPIDVSSEAETAARIGTLTGWRVSVPLTVIVSETDMIGFDVEGVSRVVRIVGAEGPQTDASLRSLLTTVAG